MVAAVAQHAHDLGRQGLDAAAARGPKPALPAAPGANAMTVDVEDYYQVQAFESCVKREDWPQYPSRVERNTDAVLTLFAERSVRATFFTLGWVAERHPQLIRRIVAATPKTRQTLLFSATMSKEIEAVTREFLKTPALVEIGARSTPAEAVAQWVVEVSMAAKVPALIHLMKDAALESVLVFSRTKYGADRIARKLEEAGIRTATLHSNRTQAQRLSALKRFKSGDVRALIATDIAARGIDVDGISHVINYDFPPQPEDYVHRIGRTGRMQAIGDAISFVTYDDADSLRRLERFLGRGITRKKLEGFVPNAPQSPPSHPPPADKGARPKGAWKPKGSRSGSFGPKRFGQRRSRPQGRRGRT